MWPTIHAVRRKNKRATLTAKYRSAKHLALKHRIIGLEHRDCRSVHVFQNIKLASGLFPFTDQTLELEQQNAMLCVTRIVAHCLHGLLHRRFKVAGLQQFVDFVQTRPPSKYQADVPAWW